MGIFSQLKIKGKMDKYRKWYADIFRHTFETLVPMPSKN